MNFGVSFAPLVPDYAMWITLGASVLLAFLLAFTRSRGALARILALAFFILALANPLLTREDRVPVPSVAAVIVDKSPSQNLDDRAKQTEAARVALLEKLKSIPGLEVRVADTPNANEKSDGTRLFSALSSIFADVPPDRIAGAIMITDGRVHDVPPDPNALGFVAPIHALITGHQNEIDRRVVLTQTPRFGIVGQSQTVGFRIEDYGLPPGSAEIVVRRDGEILEKRNITISRAVEVSIPISHAGENLIEIETPPLANELTEVNNRAVISIYGVRDKLRVLLVSGEPHAGERTWRNLLKTDASVDLVHFTILRSPEKQDGTPINELSLIAFPTRELFQQKISEFQLIIFDRYASQGVLPPVYFENIAQYVRDGGAVLVAAGPDYASQTSLWRTPLDAILPAEPDGDMTDRPYYARLTRDGERHPVTRGLEGSETNPPRWSPWFRLVNTKHSNGTVVMHGPDDKPLLILGHEDKGRVALLLSDQIWLWARGYDRGGPYLELMRRLSHWLMKQPELEEEALRLEVKGHEITVQRQTMSDSVDNVTLTAPTGTTHMLKLQPQKPGIWTSSISVDELGLWRATDGKLMAIANVGPANPREFQEVTSTPEILSELAEATGGSVHRLVDRNSLTVPRVVPVRSSSTYKGDNWIGLKMRDVSVVRGIGVLPVFAGLIGLLILIGSLATAWASEAR